MSETVDLRPVMGCSPAGSAAERRRRASPWVRWNLRWNPFGEPAPEEAGELVVAPEVEDLAEWLRRPRTALQVLGRQGRGKTARLRALGRRFPKAPYLYLPEDGPLPKLPPVPRSSAAPLGPALLLDEAQRLPRRRRRRRFRSVARRGASLVLGSHRDLGEELEAAGLEVETVVVSGLDVERLAAVVERRLEWARGRPGPLPRLDAAALGALVERFGDDLRALLDHLYEVYQRHLPRDLHPDLHEPPVPTEDDDREEAPWRNVS